MIALAVLTLGIVYDLLGSRPPRPGDPPDFEAEFEPEATVLVLEEAIRRLGHRPVRLGNAQELLARVGKGELPALDAALSIAEGVGSRNREAWAPVLLEMLGVPALGSDALTLSLTLDKHWAKQVVSEAGVPVVPGLSLEDPADVKNVQLPDAFPLFVKPRWEGTAKGITAASKVSDRVALERQVERITTVYRQPVLVEPFVAGPEYTVTVVGHGPPRALPVLQRALERSTGIGLHAVAGPPGAAQDLRHDTPGVLTAELEAQLQELAIRAFVALECRDFARVDFRLDAAGQALFLEMNPLPTFAPDGSFGIHAELEARPLPHLLAEVIDGGLRRLGLVPT